MVSNMTTLTHVNLDVNFPNEILKKKKSSNFEPLATLETKRIKVLFQPDMLTTFFLTIARASFLLAKSMVWIFS